ncbi:hypothetical protein ACHAXT_008224 [Thalassiosira profunda]
MRDGGDGGGGEEDDRLLVDPLLKYLATSNRSKFASSRLDVDAAIKALTTEGYYRVPSVLTASECDEALGRLWDFVEDVSGGCVARSDPTSWYPRHEVSISGRDDDARRAASPIISADPQEHDDLDPWPHTGYGSFPDMFQSLGAGLVLGDVREMLAERIFGPLFGTRELLSSKEGFTFSRPLVVDLEEEGCVSNGEAKLAWRPSHLQPNDNTQRLRPLFWVCGKPQPRSEGQHFDQGVPASATAGQMHATNGISKKQRNRNQKQLSKRQRYKDLTGLCHIQASVSFTNQMIDRDRGGGHFLCHKNSHSDVHRKLVGGTYRATPSHKGKQDKERADPTWVPLTDDEITRLEEMGCKETRIYAKRGDVILWRSDLVHAGVAPSLVSKKNAEGAFDYDGPREFRAVGYVGMLPVQAVEDYVLYSLPRQKVVRKEARRLVRARFEELTQQKLDAYRTGRTGDHRPDVEAWHEHRRATMWNRASSQQTSVQLPVPPRVLQRPRFRFGPPDLTVRQAELYGLLPYHRLTDNASNSGEMRQKDVERAVIRGVRFADGVYEGRHVNGDAVVGTWKVRDGKFCSDEEATIIQNAARDMPICLANMEVLMAKGLDGSFIELSGQDKWLGGMASPCGRYIYGVPGHAKRVVRVDVRSGSVDCIGPEYAGEFKWLRGVGIPANVMGTNEDGSPPYPSGCCLALPCNSEEGCVLKIDCETSEVTTFVTGPPIPAVEEGWLYHGGNLAADGFVYTIPANAPRVMKIDPRLETVEFIGPDYPGKAKWYGGIMAHDGCIYGIPHNATGVLKINPRTQEVTVLAEGSLPEGRWKWHGGLASSDLTKLIGFPNNADSVLVIDVLKQRVYTVGDASILRSGSHRVPQDGRYRYLGGALTSCGKYTYLFPCDAEHVLRFDMETDEMKLVGPRLTEGENKWQNGFSGRDDAIYGIPQRASGVLRIIPPGVERYDREGNILSADDEHVDVIYCGDDMVSCKDKFEGGVQGQDCKIYSIPLRAKAFVNIVPMRDSRVSDHRLGQNFPLQGFLGGEVGPIIDGLIARDQETKLRQLSEEAAS